MGYSVNKWVEEIPVQRKIMSLVSSASIWAIISLVKGLILLHLPRFSVLPSGTCCFGLPWVNYEIRRILESQRKSRAWHARHTAGRGNSSVSKNSASTHQLFDSNFCFSDNFSWRQLLCQYFNVFSLWWASLSPKGGRHQWEASFVL